MPSNSITIHVNPELQPQRLDIFLTEYFKKYTRSFIKKLISDNNISINKACVNKSGFTVKPNDIIEVNFPESPRSDQKILEQKEIESLNIKTIFEHKDFLIVYKPAGIITHKPSINSPEITLSDWVAYKYKEISKVGDVNRPGIVHRLDKDTSGLLIIPRTQKAHDKFTQMFKDREIKKEYLAVVQGHPKESGVIESLIIRHPRIRTKMATSETEGRKSITYYTILEYYENASLLKVSPITGRTHQIRVHLKSINHPIIGDLLYNKNSEFKIRKNLISRQALHAYKLNFKFDDRDYTFCKDVPKDIKNLKKKLNKL